MRERRTYPLHASLQAQHRDFRAWRRPDRERGTFGLSAAYVPHADINSSRRKPLLLTDRNRPRPQEAEAEAKAESSSRLVLATVSTAQRVLSTEPEIYDERNRARAAPTTRRRFFVGGR